MSADAYQKFITSTTQPSHAQVGDGWFNPSTNRTYQFVNVSGLGLQWVEQVTSAGSGTSITLGNVTVTGGTGSFSGSSSNLSVTLNNIGETVGLSTNALPGYFTYELTKQTILYATANSASTIIINFVGSSTSSLNSVMAVGQSVSAVLMLTQGSTGYLPTAYYVDGIAITPKWQGGTAPSTGSTTAIDVLSYTIIKTANATFTVLGSQTKFS